MKLKNVFQSKIVKNLLGLVLVALIMVLGFKYHAFKVDSIKEDGYITLGQIAKVDDGGEAFDMSATYYYQVENKLYSRKVEISPSDKQRNFKGCLWSSRDCSGGFAWVLYSEREPDESLINLSRIYSLADTSGLVKPKSFDGFY